jgi:ketosteroid isomerase-like protein
MSRENVENVRRSFDLWKRGDLEGWLETIDPAIGWDISLVVHETATMRDTGVPLERDLVQLWTVRGGKAVFLRVFQTKAEALEAARLED